MTQQVLHRVGFRWSEIFLYAAIGLGPLSFVCSSSAQAAPARSVIEASQVVAAMRDDSLPIEGAKVKISAPMTSSIVMAKLEVLSATVIGSHDVRLRMACLDRSACVPFFAIANYADAVDEDKFRGGKLTQQADAQTTSQSAAPASNASMSKSTNAAKEAPLLHAGASASLECDADKIHIRLEVISLQNGRPGDRVRVSSLDHKQIYTAEVVTPTLLKGELLK
jgi:flagella basal body P-ring formation protein FlgA